MNNAGRLKLFSLFILTLILIDQAVKWIMFRYWRDGVLIPGVLQISKKINRGLIFQLGSGISLTEKLILPISILGIAGVIYLYIILKRKFNNDLLAPVFMVLALSGVISNSLDRIFLGYTRDFIKWFGPGVANLSDIYIYSGLFSLVIGWSRRQAITGLTQRRSDG